MSQQIEVKDKREHRFFTVDTIFIDNYAKDLGATTVAVYIRLCRHADIHRRCFPSIAFLAESLGLSERTVRRSLKDLQEWNIISTERIWRKGTQASNNTYTLVPVSQWKQGTPLSYAKDEADDKNDMGDDKKQRTFETEAGDTRARISRTIKKKNQDVAPDGDDQKVQKTFSAQEWVDLLLKDPKAHIRLIGYYFAKYSEHHFPTKKTAEDELRKNLKPAVYLLENYTKDDITKTLKHCQENFNDVHWNLSTVKKQIAHVTARKT